MATLRDVVSDIRSLNKLISKDALITDRAIAAEVKSSAALLIKRELVSRRLWSTPTIFTPIDCIIMEEASLAECCDYTSPCTIRKSKCKIKGIADLGRYGLAIQGVFNIINSKKYKEVSPTRYANLLKLNIPNKKDFFWFKNDYLYISDPDVERVSMFAYGEDRIQLIGEGCSCTNDNKCINPLDEEFKCPGDLLDNVKSMVHERIQRIYKVAVDDKTSDDKDDTR